MSSQPLTVQETRIVLTDAAAAERLAGDARQQGLVVSTGHRGAHYWVSWLGEAALPLPPGAERFSLCAERPRLDTPGLLLMDMDSTAIDIECIDEIARAGGVYDEVSQVTEAAMRGELGFEESLRQRVAKLDGIPASVLDEIAANLPLNPGLEALVLGLKQAGWKVALASGGFNRIASVLAAQLGLDHFQANDLEEAGGLLTGQVCGEIVGAEVKAAILAQLGEKYGIPQCQWVAMGDGANDLPMMNRAALGVGFRAKPAVAAQADAHLAALGLDATLVLLI